ncbi:MAG: Fic family protein [Acidobacteria bacterium]|nr:Fic family protein [Acidobacteriota bacterium]
MDYQWQPIADLESDEALASDELGALALVWREQRERLGNREAYREFEERLKREWAVETGLIERLYTLDRGITQLLIEHGIQSALIPHRHGANPEGIAAIITDHKEAVEGVFDFVKAQRPLSTSYVKELHALMTRHQDTVEGIDSLGRKTSVPLIRGAYKQLPNNPLREDGSIHEYCPPEHVASEMDRLIALHHGHDDVAPEVEAAWLHHRFAQIHPFQDGNGRIARALATLVLVKAGWFPLVVRDRERATYIGALEAADHGDLKPLIEYFAKRQRDAFVSALNIAADVRKALRVADTIQSARRQLQQRRDALIAEWNAAKSIAAALRDQAECRLEEVAGELEREMHGVLDQGGYFTSGAEDGGNRSHYFRHQIIETAGRLDYFANLEIHRAWARLALRNTNVTELLIAFHGFGRDFQGVLACSASWFQRVETDDGEREVGPVTPVTDRVFLINYKESPEAAAARFSDWLEDAIVRGLKLWQETAL